ncbi:MAG: phosphonopyruvate decarboxylase [Lentimicrobiaceae bacterium]|nr:phosphonopyruvate decarboxylase [Lentimicrobiaceae bacterium]
MISSEFFFNACKDEGVDFFSGVPDSLLKNICSYITDNTPSENHIIAANEGNALAIGVGYHLSTGKVPLIYMQNSGLGNVINPLLSLADQDVYSVPLLMMIGWRGEPGVKDEPQHKKQGRVTVALLEAMEIPYKVLTADSNIEEAKVALKAMLSIAKKENKPCALLIKKGFFEDYKFQSDILYERPLYREQAIEIIVNNLNEPDIVVSTTGVASRELFEYREKLKSGHERDFLTVGGMGHVSQIALGIALQKKNRQVYCLDGDGSLIMHMGTLAINASMNCRNFKHIVFNNSAHDSVGGQPTVGDRIDIASIASNVGYQWVKMVSEESEIRLALNEMADVDTPALLEIQVKKGFRKDLGRPTTTPIQNKEIFMKFVAG